MFGDNEDCVRSCPECQAGWDDGSETEETDSERNLTFRMSEFETETDSDAEGTRAPAESTSETAEGASRFGRVGRAVSGLF
ncbi:hypothetical protein HacjB3_01400 [Halalkalicoccus jeotgali B3]|uniref:Uncharacterized protein n=1 Tax=Halalkalicoccus jeotgali (strain DSM 18796 / CECT 7217 / JCM 14584 / KCTC 4019 / B3) TaxID=795797 RepID=D8J592_HALJB|nr:hypothetical protein HacjB3_01400 [Halalkalicoccus jeotgali B3]